MKKIKLFPLFFVIFLTACSSNSSNSTNNLDDNNKSSQASTKNYSDTSHEKQSASKDSPKDKVSPEHNVTEKIKNYIINGQENKPEAQKIKWSKTFLNQVDIESLYKQYIANGGNADDLESFDNVYDSKRTYSQ